MSQCDKILLSHTTSQSLLYGELETHVVLGCSQRFTVDFAVALGAISIRLT